MVPLKPDISSFLSTERQRCRIGQFIEQLEPQDRVNFEAALKEPRVLQRRLREWLREKGFDASEKTLSRHRRGECHCDD